MAGLRCTDVQSRSTECLDFTSATLDEFQALVPPFETEFHARMAAWRFDGKPRTARQFTVEFIPLKPSAATGSDEPGNDAGHSRVPSPARGRPPSTGVFCL